MKNKTIFITIILLFLVMFLFLNIKQEVRFNRYASTEITESSFNFGVIRLGEKVNKVFKIKNKSKKEPFVVIKIATDEDVVCNKNIENKAILPDQEKLISVEFKPTSRGKITKKIKIESNSSSGLIELELKGIVE
jgi:hypothetical protein